MEGETNSQLERILVIFLVIVFGSGSLLSLSGVWSEIPVLVALGLPEGYRINSIVVILVQIGSFGIIAFLICNKCLASSRVYRPEIPVIYFVTFVGTIGTFLMIFFWNTPTYFSGDSTPHSVAFLTLILFITFVDMTANTTFFGFMSLMKAEYLNWFWIGQGMSNILPACVVLIQQSGGSKEACVANYTFINETVIGNSTLTYSCTSWREVPPGFLFGPDKYFGFLFIIMLSCHISSICLNILPCARREYAHQKDGHHLKRDGCGGLFRARGNSGEMEELVSFTPLTLPNLDRVDSSGTHNVDGGELMDGDILRWQLGFLYTMSFLSMAVMYGILAPLQGYSGSAYGSQTFGLVMPLREITGALAFLLFLLKPVYSFKVVAWSFVLGCISGVYCILVAAMSPEPPLKNLLIGKVLIVLAWMSSGLFLSYSRAAISWILRHTSENRTHLIMNGAVGQGGVVIAAIVMYVLINVYNVFEENHDQERCPIYPTCIRYGY